MHGKGGTMNGTNWEEEPNRTEPVDLEAEGFEAAKSGLFLNGQTFCEDIEAFWSRARRPLLAEIAWLCDELAGKGA